MTMMAGLVAKLPDVHLQRVNGLGAEGGHPMFREGLRKEIGEHRNRHHPYRRISEWNKPLIEGQL